MPLSEYLDRTRRSSLVFSAPSVHACLGWKLGEYLALGKAIVSTELGRALPAPLEHGVHVHYVRSEVDDMTEAIEEINRNSGYRRTLERGARRWYEEYMAPSVVAAKLIDRAS
jgi:glycosyltransferase involved in cell wall biosynthesis